MIVVLETSNARPQRIAVFLYGHGSASTISQRTYFCHVPGHICLLSPPPEECLPVGECLFVIAGQCLTPVFTFLGQTFLALSIMSWHKRDWGAVSLIESRVSSGPVDHPPTDCQVSRSDMHFLDFIHSLWKVRKWAFNVKIVIKDVCNIAALPLPSKRNKWIFCSVL